MDEQITQLSEWLMGFARDSIVFGHPSVLLSRELAESIVNLYGSKAREARLEVVRRVRAAGDPWSNTKGGNEYPRITRIAEEIEAIELENRPV